ncbi:hypothetical protein D3C71_1150270 [compost metagenome]
MSADTGGKHDQVGFEEFVIGEIHAIAVLLARTDRLRGAGQVYTDAQSFDLRLERLATEVIQLYRHQARREFHHVGFKAQALQRVRGFQPQQATADHHAAPGIGRRSPNGIEVFQGAIDQARFTFGAFDWRNERIRTGGQNQFVIRDATLRGDHLATDAVDFQYRHTQMQRNAGRLVKRRIGQRQRLGITTGEVLGKMHTVIGAHRLLTEDVQPVMVKRSPLDQLFDTMMSDHAITDHDQRLHLVQRGNIGIHRKHPARANHGFKSKKKRLKPCGSRRLCLFFCGVETRHLCLIHRCCPRPVRPIDRR